LSRAYRLLVRQNCLSWAADMPYGPGRKARVQSNIAGSPTSARRCAIRLDHGARQRYAVAYYTMRPDISTLSPWLTSPSITTLNVHKGYPADSQSARTSSRAPVASVTPRISATFQRCCQARQPRECCPGCSRHHSSSSTAALPPTGTLMLTAMPPHRSGNIHPGRIIRQTRRTHCSRLIGLAAP